MDPELDVAAGSSPAPGIEQAAPDQGAVLDQSSVDVSSGENTPADPPSAEPSGETPAPSLLDIVRDVVQPKAEAPEAPPASSEAPAPEVPPEAKAEDADAEDASLPFHHHPRFKQVTKERREFKELAEARAYGDQQFQAIEGFMKSNGLAAAEVAEGFKVMSLIRNDPMKALEELYRWVDVVRADLGLKLPDDLNQQVEEGAITEELARELFQARKTSAVLEHQTRERQQQEQAVQAEQAVARFTAEVNSTVNDWRKDMMGRDPDFPKMEQQIADRIHALVNQDFNGRMPADVNAIRTILNRAHSDVRNNISQLIPRRAASRNMDVGVSRETQLAPKNTFDVVRMTVGRG